MRQRESEKLAFGKFQEVSSLNDTRPFRSALMTCPPLAAGEELATAGVSRAVARIDKNIRRAVHEDEARADQKFWLVFDIRVVEFL